MALFDVGTRAQTANQEVMSIMNDRESHDGSSIAEMTDDQYRYALERAQAVQGFFIHLLVFAVVNAGLFAINWLATGGEGGWWFQWPLVAWGIGLLIHLLTVITPVFSPDWAERRAHRMVAREH
jgi:hypothetical protein